MFVLLIKLFEFLYFISKDIITITLYIFRNFPNNLYLYYSSGNLSNFSGRILILTLFNFKYNIFINVENIKIVFYF